MPGIESVLYMRTHSRGNKATSVSSEMRTDLENTEVQVIFPCFVALLRYNLHTEKYIHFQWFDGF